MLDVFILPTGRPFFDIIFAKVPHWVRPGEELFAEKFTTCAGGSYNIAISCHKLGLEVGLSAHLGTDFFSGAIRQAIISNGMSTDYIIEHPESKTAVTASVSRFDDRALISYVDAVPDFDPADLPDHGTPNVIFVPGVPKKPELLFGYLDKMKNAGSMLVCDCAHISRSIQDKAVFELISRMDIFLCNQKEAQTLTSRSNTEKAAQILSKLCPEIVIKLGIDGAIALEGGLIHREPKIPIKILDTTGAGDGFNAGYLYGLLEGYLVERRLRLGNIVGACIVEGLGSENAPTLEKVLKIEKEQYF